MLLTMANDCDAIRNDQLDRVPEWEQDFEAEANIVLQASFGETQEKS